VIYPLENVICLTFEPIITAKYVNYNNEKNAGWPSYSDVNTVTSPVKSGYYVKDALRSSVFSAILKLGGVHGHPVEKPATAGGEAIKASSPAV
jgi:hypothetical protein